jgi:DNA-binding CsgD family transcriptional regulator
MAAMTAKMYERLLGCVGRLFECENVEQFERVTLEEISGLVGCDHVTFNYVAPTIPEATSFGFPALPGPHQGREQLLSRYLEDDPILNHFLRTGDGEACKLSDFLSVRQYHTLPLYRDFYHDLRYEDQLAFMLFPPGCELISIALARDRRSFTEGDRQVLNLARPYVARAYRRVERDQRLRRSGSERGSLRADSRVTTIVLDAEDQPVQFGEAALQWMALFFPDRPRQPARLPETVAGWLRRTRRNGSASSRDDGHNRLVQEREDQRLRLRVYPGQSGAERILVMGLQARNAGGSSFARTLTQREIEVLREVEQGKSNDEVSVTLGISSLTVRTHLEHIFDKLRVPSRTGAVLQFRRLCERGLMGMSGVFWLMDEMAFQIAALAA